MNPLHCIASFSFSFFCIQGCATQAPPSVDYFPPAPSGLEERLFERFRNSILEKAESYSDLEKQRVAKRTIDQLEIIEGFLKDGWLTTEQWHFILLNRLDLKTDYISASAFVKKYGSENFSRADLEGLTRYELEVEITKSSFHPWHYKEVIELLENVNYSKNENKIHFNNVAKTLTRRHKLTCFLDEQGKVYKIQFPSD